MYSLPICLLKIIYLGTFLPFPAVFVLLSSLVCIFLFFITLCLVFLMKVKSLKYYNNFSISASISALMLLLHTFFLSFYTHLFVVSQSFRHF